MPTNVDAADLVDFTPVEPLTDARGQLLEPIPDTLLSNGNILHLHVVGCAVGSVRGNHVHRLQTETFIVVEGTFRTRLRDTRSDNSAELILSAEEPRLIAIPAGIAHAFLSMGPTAGVLLGYANRAFDPADIYRFPLFH